MNRFRTRRRARDQPADPDLDHAGPLGLHFSTKPFGRNKKPVPESKPDVDLARVLPDSHDFRTSLLMPNLSARFSMLREQDDPATKIGKANDDSVLFPKRASRLNIFADSGLHNIVEGDPVPDLPRPTFALSQRTRSEEVDGYDSDGGSGIMSRPRPEEGNNLFGGRQKLYKIPAQPFSKSQTNLATMTREPWTKGGKTLYEDDIAISLFRNRHPEQQDDPRQKVAATAADDGEEASMRSPTTSFNKFRETTSSTTSGPRRLSTAATSVDSQPFSPLARDHHHPHTSPTTSSSKGVLSPGPAGDRHAGSSRKLYEQAISPSHPSHLAAKEVLDVFGRSATDLRDRKHNLESPANDMSAAKRGPPDIPPLHTGSQSRTLSPPASEPSSSIPDLRPRAEESHAPDATGNPSPGAVHPLSPPASEAGDASAFAQSLSPEDRGKVTAMGLFNRPQQHYDEEQFSRRQLQLQQERGAAPTSSPLASRGAKSTPALLEGQPRPITRTKSQEEAPLAEENQTDASTRTSHNSSPGDHLRAQPPLPPQPFVPTPPKPGDADSVGPSVPPKDTEAPPSKSPNSLLRETHPALRTPGEDFKFPDPDGSTTRQPPDDGIPPPVAVDSPPPADHSGLERDATPAGLGLSGLVRTHLRADSDKSSLFPSASPHASLMPPPVSHPDTSPGEGREDIAARADADTPDPQPTMAQSAKQILATAQTIIDTAKDDAARSELQTRPNESHVPRPAGPHQEAAQHWPDELQVRHQRDGSTETQHERAAFNKELAERRRKVQESLKKVTEVSSRSGSPTPSVDSAIAKAGSGFSAILRGKTSRSKMAGAAPPPVQPPPMPMAHLEQQPDKAMKVLGLGGPGHSSTGHPPLRKSQEELWMEEERLMLESFAQRPKPRTPGGSSPGPLSARPLPRPRPGQAPVRADGQANRPTQRSVTPTTRHQVPRDRSSSDVSGSRSKSLHRTYRDDLERAMVDGRGVRAQTPALPTTSNASVSEPVSAHGREPSERSASAMSGYSSVDHQPPNSGVPDRWALKALKVKDLAGPASGRSSPGMGYTSSHHTSPIDENLALGSNSIRSVTPSVTPPASEGRTTPALSHRKRSITKNMISEPTFISTTHAASTVDLPRGNIPPDMHGREVAPPALPAMNPRRRGRVGVAADASQTAISRGVGHATDGRVRSEAHPHSADATTGASGPVGDGASSKGGAVPSSPERNDMGMRPAPLRAKPRLRKISSEGGDLNSKARQQALMTAPSPALPTFPVVRGGPAPKAPAPMLQMEGGMF